MKLRPLLLVTSTLALVGGSGLAGPNAMTPEEARHLISRTGFGASPQEISALTGKSYTEGVKMILGTLSTEPHLPMPAWVNAPDYPTDFIWVMGQTADELFFSNRWMEIEELSGWWMAEMVATPSPLTERLTLFWHDHFATSYDVIENSQWMGRQNQFFRANAAGNFADLAHGILKDPAMLAYLSNTENYADSPNENLGREFLELFTLGEGRGYTQADVESAARALTGHTVAELTAPTYVFNAQDHDHGQKTLFGQTGNFGATDLAEMALSHPDFGPYIVEKLWRVFVSDRPDPIEVERLTEVWLDNSLEIEPLLQAMFLTEAFWAVENRGRLVKSPVELIVGTLRSLGTPVENATGLAWLSYDMGQALFFPPNVGGWPDGADWINDASVTARATTLSYFAFEGSEVSYEDATMMTGQSGRFDIIDVGPDDLRVGQVFALDLEQHEHGFGGLFILYDVSFGGETWRSIPVWLEANDEENFAGYGLVKTDCQPTCFPNIGEDAWVWYAPWEGVLEEHLAAASDFDIALMQAVTAHLPELVQTTQDQITWQPDPDMGSEYSVPTLEVATQIAQDLARDSEKAIGATSGTLVLGLSSQGLLGLEGYSEVSSPEGIDAYVEQAEQARIRPAIPAVTYDSARAWLNDLPGGGFESQRAISALLAVPRQTLGQREEMITSDPDALVRTLILSPEFQVN